MEAPPPAINTESSVSASTRESTGQLNMSQTSMFRSLSRVFGDVVPRKITGLGFDEWPSLLEHADSGFETAKALQAVVSILIYLERKSPVTLVAATKILADGSRDESFRLPFGDENVLGFYLDLLAKDAYEHDWTLDALRLVGNTCADLDVNRERALAKLDLPALLRRLTEEATADITLGVLCNLCLDYEPAQAELRNKPLLPSIIQLLERRFYNINFLPQVSLLLDIAMEDFNPEVYPNSQAIAVIYQTITIPGLDIETQVSLATTILAFSKHEQIQKILIADDNLLTILDLFVFTYTQDAANAKDKSKPKLPKLHHRAQDPEDEAQLTSLRAALSAGLWDISTLTEFTAKHSPESEFVQRLISWLLTDEPQMQLCACSILRNVASSDQNATDMVMNLKIQRLLIPFLDSCSNLQVLEELLRLMKNLAVPAANKIQLDAFGTATLTWTKYESPTLHYAAASVVRQLLKGCYSNVHRFLTQSTSAKNASYASQMLQLYSNTDDSTIKIEIARTVVEVWRTANSGDSKETCTQVSHVEDLLREGNVSPNEMVEPVVVMLVNSENASLVTEGWFGLVLMAGSEQLREVIYQTLCGDATKAVFEATISSEAVHSKDRDNALILADRLLKDPAANSARREVLGPLVSREVCYSEVEWT